MNDLQPAFTVIGKALPYLIIGISFIISWKLIKKYKLKLRGLDKGKKR